MQKEKKIEIKQLKGDYKKTYQKMMQYISAFALNKYAKEELELEIIGICLENQKRNIPMSEVFDNDYKAFCDNLIGNTKRQTSVVRFLFYITLFLIIVACTFSLMMVCTVFLPFLLPNDGIYMKDFILYMDTDSLFHTLCSVTCLQIANFWIFRRSFADMPTTYLIYFIGFGGICGIAMYFISQLEVTIITFSILHLFFSVCSDICS